ncbi:MAG TPA: TPM domain-containing protein [Candidatus Binatia bacterium]|nr:TPM domain-containing protein [Candidatus Binatia bacterium]
MRLVRSLAALLVAASALALPGAIAVADHTLPPSEEGRYVYDLAEIWRPETIAFAQHVAETIRERTQAQIAVVSWPSDDLDVSTETAREDAIVIMDTWGVGRAGINDGLVVLFDMDRGSKDHGQIYAYAGSGFRELYLDQGESDALVFEVMLPKAIDGDLDASLRAGMEELDKAVQPGGNPGRASRALFNAILAGIAGGSGLAVFGLFLRTWWRSGRDAEIPLVDDSVLMPGPPPGMTPALATVLRNGSVDRDAFTSALVDLGHRGLVTFQEAKGWGTKVDLVVPPAPLIDPNSLEARRRPLGDAENSLARSIASKAVGGVLSWSQLKAGEGAKLWESFRKYLGRAARKSGYFREDPNHLTSQWVGIATFLIVGVVIFGFIFVLDTNENSDRLVKFGREFLVIPIGLSIALGVLTIILSGRLVARTAEGSRALAMAIGYRNTLRWEMRQSKTVDEAMEKTRSKLPWITTPDLLTVWAVAFGLKDEIDDLIKETFKEAERTGSASWTPAWYASSDGISSLGNLSSSVASISTSTTSSSGGGYGGGSSGGGGGSGGGF